MFCFSVGICETWPGWYDHAKTDYLKSSLKDDRLCGEGVLYVSNVKAIKKNEKFDVIKIRVLLLNFQIPPPLHH